jgi:hypothetical protein
VLEAGPAQVGAAQVGPGEPGPAEPGRRQQRPGQVQRRVAVQHRPAGQSGHGRVHVGLADLQGAHPGRPHRGAVRGRADIGRQDLEHLHPVLGRPPAGVGRLAGPAGRGGRPGPCSRGTPLGFPGPLRRRPVGPGGGRGRLGAPGGDPLQPVDAAQAHVQLLAAQLVQGPGEPLGGLLLAGHLQLLAELAAVGVELLPGGGHGRDHGHPGHRLEQADADVVLELEPLVLQPAPGRRVADPGQRRRRPGGHQEARGHEHDQEQPHGQDPRPVPGQPRQARQPADHQQPGNGRQRHQPTPTRLKLSGHSPPKPPVTDSAEFLTTLDRPGAVTGRNWTIRARPRRLARR